MQDHSQVDNQDEHALHRNTSKISWPGSAFAFSPSVIRGSQALPVFPGKNNLHKNGTYFLGVGRGAGTQSQLSRKAAGPVRTCTSKRGILGHHLTPALADYAPGPEIPH